MDRNEEKDVMMSEDGRTALTGDGGPISSDFQWEESVQVSNDDDE